MQRPVVGLGFAGLREHSGRALWGARYSADKGFVLLTCYLDEAIDEKEGFTVVCGSVSTVATYPRRRFLGVRNSGSRSV